jgi:hypothetical protein
MHHNAWCLESIGERIGVSSVPTPLLFTLFMCCVLQETHFDSIVICKSKCTTIIIKLHTGRRGRADRSLLLHIREIGRVKILVRRPMTYNIYLGHYLTSLRQTKGHYLKFLQLTLHCFPRCTAWVFIISRAAGLGAPCTLGYIYVHYKFNKAMYV